MKLDPKKTAMLTLDFQRGILGMVPDTGQAVAKAARAAEFARERKYSLIHVGLGFAEGYPEIPDASAFATRIKPSGAFVIGSASAEFDASIARPSELRVYKQRVGAFSENQLHMILRARGIENLVMFGVATSGIVLSTVRRAFDLDFQSLVLEDACFDPDAEVHRVLTQKVFPRQVEVSTVDAFIAEQDMH